MGDYKSILVHYDAGRSAAPRLEYAIGVARMFDAHIACLYALDLPNTPVPGFEGRQILLEALKRSREENLAAAHASFDACLRRADYAKIEWRETGADALGAVALHARYADLVVIGQHDADRPSGVERAFARDLPLHAGRPVLIVPYAFEPRGAPRRILVAWNAGREAARAVSDALPLLKRASHVEVVTVNARASASGHGEEPGADIGLLLARHGIKVTVAPTQAPELDAGNVLLSRANDLQADLIVSGAWGHSRLHENFMGGVTRTFLESMTVPVLFSH
jgi:nucleotide-binding universal stress UspA family protein